MTSGTEDVALELLHAELVSQVCSKPLGSQERAKALSDLELVGYNAGYRHVLLLTITLRDFFRRFFGTIGKWSFRFLEFLQFCGLFWP